MASHGSPTMDPAKLKNLKNMNQRPSFVMEVLQSPRDIVRRASVTVATAPRNVARRASHVLTTAASSILAVKDALRPDVDTVGIDVLGLAAPDRPESAAELSTASSVARLSIFEEADLFEVEVEDANGDLSPMIAGQGLTSLVLHEEGDDGKGLDWAAELLLLTHEPLRRDMLEMQRALQPRYFGELPDSWRVHSFFRFYQSWCSLVSQQHAVEVSVHYDWLVAPTNKMQGEHRSELLSYHRTIELELLAISRLEQKIVEELTSAADWTTAEPWSEQSQVLRDRLNKLCAQIRMHMATQESLLPDMLREHWGHVSPPQLMLRSLQAAKRAQAQGAKSLEKPKLLMWVLHYLERRAPHRARYVRAALPMLKRLRLALGRDASHSKVLGHLRCIILDEAPRTSVAVLAQSGGETSTRESQRMDEDSGAGGGGTELEKQRKAGMVNAVLAAANARRVDVPFNSNETTRVLASSEAPLHTFKMDGKWADKADKVPDNLYKKIGVEKPKTPRRL